MSDIKSLNPFDMAPKLVWPDETENPTVSRRAPEALDKVRISFGKPMKNGFEFMPVYYPFHPEFNPLGLGTKHDRKLNQDYGPNLNIATTYDPAYGHMVMMATPAPIEGAVNSWVVRQRNKEGNGKGYFYTHVPIGKDQPLQFYSLLGKIKCVPHTWKLHKQYSCITIPLTHIIKVRGYDENLPEKQGRNNTGTDWS